jgi:hypothetical protein
MKTIPVEVTQDDPVIRFRIKSTKAFITLGIPEDAEIDNAV